MCDDGGGGSSTTVVQDTQFDPLYPGSGGSDVRSEVYGTRKNLAPTWDSRAATSAAGLESKAGSPAWDSAFQLFQNQIAGDYLNGSPQLDTQISTMRAQSSREAGDQQADIRSKYAKTGNSLSTGVNQQLLNAGAASRARSDANEATIRGQNYVRERDFQNRAPQSAEYAANVPSNLRAQATNVQFDPLSKSAQLATGLSGGASTNNSSVIQKPGALDYTLGFANALG